MNSYAHNEAGSWPTQPSRSGIYYSCDTTSPTILKVLDPGHEEISSKFVETAVIINKYFYSTLLHLLPCESKGVFPISYSVYNQTGC